MNPRTSLGIAVVAALIGGASTLHAQSLADAARKADDQKRAAKGTKTYTNKDVGDVPPATAGPTVSATGATDPTAKPAGEKPAAGTEKPAAGTEKPGTTTPAETKDQAYYSGRMKELQGKLDRDTAFLNAIQSQINALTADFIARDDPAQKSQIEQNRNKALAQQASLQKEITADKKAISDFQEEARKSGAPAGWLR